MSMLISNCPHTAFWGASVQEVQNGSKNLKEPESLCKRTHGRHAGIHMPFLGTEKAQPGEAHVVSSL